jgi:hypothetical protein
MVIHRKLFSIKGGVSMKKPEPIKATYRGPAKSFMFPSPARMTFDKPLSLEQIEKITEYLAGKMFISRMPGPRKPKEVAP